MSVLRARWLAFGALLGLAIPALALDPGLAISQYRVDRWTKWEGLPQNSVLAMAEDSRGYVWLGTQEGLSRFDGTAFRSFRLEDTPELGDNYISALYAEADGSLWIGTANGRVRRYDGTRFHSPVASTEYLGEIRAISSDGEGAAFRLSYGRPPSSRRGQPAPAGARQGRPSDRQRRRDHARPRWRGLGRRRRFPLPGKERRLRAIRAAAPRRPADQCPRGGPGRRHLDRHRRAVGRRYEQRGGRLVPSGEPFEAGGPIRALRIDTAGTLWIGGTTGLARIRATAHPVVEREPGTIGGVVDSLLEDHAGGLWVGTHAAGAVRLRYDETVPFGKPEGLPDDATWNVLQTSDRALWVSTNGGFVRRLAGRFERTAIPGFPSEDVVALLEARDGTVWAGTYGNGLFRLPHAGRPLERLGVEDGLPPGPITAVFEDSDGALWIGSREGLARRPAGGPFAPVPLTGPAQTYVSSILEDRSGRVWIATSNGLFASPQKSGGRVIREPGLGHAPLNALFVDAEGRLWVATNDRGIAVLEGGRFWRIDRSRGFPAGLVLWIVEDLLGHLWFFDQPRHLPGPPRRPARGGTGPADRDRGAPLRSRRRAARRRMLRHGTAGGLAHARRAGLVSHRLGRDRDRSRADPGAAPTHRDARSRGHRRRRSAPGRRPIDGISAGPRRARSPLHGAGLGRSEWDHLSLPARRLRPGLDRGGHAAGRLLHPPLSPLLPLRRPGAPRGWRRLGTFRLGSPPLAPHLHQTWVFRILAAAAAALLAIGLVHLRSRRLSALVAHRTAELSAANCSLTESFSREAELRVRAEQASAVKAEFLATVSHELRTPLNAILGFSEMLRDSPLTPRQREFVAAVQSSGESLLRLVNEILDLTRAESGALALTEEVFPLAETFESALDLVAADAAAKGLELAMAIAPGADCQARGDGPRLRQIVINLLANAVKFTERGGVAVWVEAAETDGRLDVRFEVVDSGIGITAGERDRIFDPFHQVEASHSRRYEGSGLGLAITRRLLQAMEGTITVESQLGLGSVFRAAVKLRKAAETPSMPPPPLAHRSVLITGFSPPVEHIVSRQLASWGARVRPLPPAGPSDRARRRPAAFGIASGPLPAGGASLVPAWLRLVPANETGEVHPGEIRLRWPLSPSKLAAAIGRLLGDAPAVEPAPVEIEPSAARALPVSGVPPRLLVVEDNQINQMVVLAMLESLGLEADLAASGPEALDLFTRTPYNLILLDIRMPGMDGLELTRRIRSRTGIDQPKIVALTASAMEEDRQRCLAAGVDAYLSKPVRIDDLVAVLARFSPPGCEPAPPPK